MKQSLKTSLADLVTFSSRMVNFSGSDETVMDELRIGADFVSVVTEPKPVVGSFRLLGGFSFLALLHLVSLRTP